MYFSKKQNLPCSCIGFNGLVNKVVLFALFTCVFATEYLDFFKKNKIEYIGATDILKTLIN